MISLKSWRTLRMSNLRMSNLAFHRSEHNMSWKQQPWWKDNSWGNHTDSGWEEDSHWSAWGEDKKPKQQDRFRNVTTLGCFGKHPMNLEDRTDLLLGVVNALVPANNLSQMAVASWGAEATMAAFWLLTNQGPTHQSGG